MTPKNSAGSKRKGSSSTIDRPLPTPRWRGEKHKKGGWIVFYLISFSQKKTQNTNDQKQLRQLLKMVFRSVCSGMINRENREEAGHKQFIQVPSTNRK